MLIIWNITLTRQNYQHFNDLKDVLHFYTNMNLQLKTKINKKNTFTRHLKT